MPPDVGLMRTYNLLASPTLHPGQVVRAHLSADLANRAAIEVALTAVVHDTDDVLERVTGSPTALPCGGDTTVSWLVPDLGGRPIGAIGIAMTNRASVPEGTVYLDWLDWNGGPDVVLRRPEREGVFWCRACVDVRIESEVTVHLGSGSLAACVQGLRRYYAMLLRRPGRLVLLQARDGTERILGEAEFSWEWDEPVRLGLAVRDGIVTGEAGGGVLFAIEEGEHPLCNGAVALAIETGAMSTSSVTIGAAGSAR